MHISSRLDKLGTQTGHVTVPINQSASLSAKGTVRLTAIHSSSGRGFMYFRTGEYLNDHLIGFLLLWMRKLRRRSENDFFRVKSPEDDDIAEV